GNMWRSGGGFALNEEQAVPFAYDLQILLSPREHHFAGPERFSRESLSDRETGLFGDALEQRREEVRWDVLDDGDGRREIRGRLAEDPEESRGPARRRAHDHDLGKAEIQILGRSPARGGAASKR